MPFSRLRNIISLVIILFGCSANMSGQLIAPFTEEEYGTSWDDPVHMTFDSKGQAYVVERHGLVWMVDDEGEKSDEPFVDIREEVSLFGDHGLLGFALDPAFESNHRVYLLYVVDRHHLLYYGTPEYDPAKTVIEQATIGRVTRYTADESTNFLTVDPDSRKVLLGDSIHNGIPVLMASHGVGSLVFGTDGTLLVSCGEAGSFSSFDYGNAIETSFDQALEDGIIRPKENIGSFRAQLIDCLNGKIIRIDPETGSGLPSNPYYDPAAPNAPRSKVWSLGFRNPYRFVLQPGTGSHVPEEGDPGVLFVGDVGAGAWEELDIVDGPGMNFGWPLYEGHNPNYGFLDSILYNPDEPNPLAGNGCEEYYFSFNSLIKQPLRDDEPFFPNPCNSEEHIPADNNYFVHSEPAMSWSNEKFNKPTRAVVTSWNADGRLLPIDIEDASSYVEGTNFEGSSSIPGFFYTGNALPEEYQDKLFICDFTGWIRIMDFDDANSPTKVDSLHTDIRRVVSMAQDNDGFIYHINQFNKIYRIRYGGNSAPNAVMGYDRNYGPGPLEVNFDASGSSDPNGDSITYHWDFGDGEESTDIAPVHVFAGQSGQPIRYDVVLTVTDSSDASRKAVDVVTVDNTPPNVDITSIEDGQVYSMTDVNFLPLKADVVDMEHSGEDLNYSWQVFLHHNDHFHPEFPINEVEAWAGISPAGCGDEIYYYRIALTVTDAVGLTGYDEVTILPYCGDDLVESLVLNADAYEDRVELAWDVVESDEIVKYEVERAEKFDHYINIGETTGNERAYMDEFPLPNVSTYRLRALREDGVYTYSNEVEVDLQRVRYKDPFRLFPNPVSDELTVFMPETISSGVEFEMYTASGIEVASRLWSNPLPTSSLVETVDVSGFIPGIYYIRLVDGEKTYRGTVVVVEGE